MFFGRELKIIKIFGIKLVIDPSWILIFILITWSFATGILPKAVSHQSFYFYGGFGLLASFLFFSSVVIHEFFHSIVARRNGLKIEKITLFFFGGASNLPEEPASAPIELKMAIAGPLSSFVLAGVFLYMSLLIHNVSLNIILQTVGVINLGLAAFNLLPGFPLDGGRIFRALIWRISNNFKKATKVATDFGKIIAVALIIFGAFGLLFINFISGLWFVLIGIFLLQAAEISYQQSLILPILKEKKAYEIMEAGVGISNANNERTPSVDPEVTALNVLNILSEGESIVLVKDGSEIIGYITIQSFGKILK